MKDNTALNHERVKMLKQEHEDKRSALARQLEMSKESEEWRRREIERKARREEEQWSVNKRAKLVQSIQLQQDRILDLQLKRDKIKENKATADFIDGMIARAMSEVGALELQISN